MLHSRFDLPYLYFSITLVGKYTAIKELDTEIIREFIEKIIMSNAEKVNNHRTQRIQIIYNRIETVAFPEKHENRHSRYSQLCRFFQEK